jgi:hypothetical protein
MAYPKSRFGVSDYELVIGVTLNRFVGGAAKALFNPGFPPVVKFYLRQYPKYF